MNQFWAGQLHSQARSKLRKLGFPNQPAIVNVIPAPVRWGWKVLLHWLMPRQVGRTAPPPVRTPLQAVCLMSAMDSTTDTRRESKFSQESADFQFLPRFTPPGFWVFRTSTSGQSKDPREFSHGNRFTIADPYRFRQDIRRSESGGYLGSATFSRSDSSASVK